MDRVKQEDAQDVEGSSSESEKAKKTSRKKSVSRKPGSRKSAKKKPAKRASVAASPTSAKGQPWTFPKNSLEDAIKIAKAIEDKNAGNPMHSGDLAVAVGFRQPSDWRFLDLLRSANQYGLVTKTGATSIVPLSDLGADIVAPSTPQQRSNALWSAFRNVKDFQSVEEFYKDKRIPEDEFFLNTLTREFDIARDRVEHFAKIFRENIRYLRSFVSADVSVSKVSSSAPVGANDNIERSLASGISESRTREFLDTCFVMMPFGEWYDKYYREIYVPAIKEAGFEPVRADQLFTTGSVVEQIWEQIDKSEVLLADLSGRNPNVFYELGLAHAARKPVVFTACSLDDIPFDLRHLRIIIYDIREPSWAQLLRKSISDYLRNATREPEKSIPHPFRASEGGGVR